MSQQPQSIVRVALPVPLEQPFDYVLPRGTHADRGAWVRVRLGARSYSGVVTDLPAVAAVAEAKLKPIIRLAAELPCLGEEQFALARFIADYYQAAPGMALALFQPPPAARARTAPELALRLTSLGREARVSARARLQSKMLEAMRSSAPTRLAELAGLGAGAKALLRAWLAKGWVEPAADPARAPTAFTMTTALNSEQARCAQAVIGSLGRFDCFVLRGITGSGKTAVYMKAAAEAMARGGQVLLLVPEINLTPQLAERIREYVPGLRLAVLHSALSASQRSREWRLAAGGEADLVVGTRLAVFTPLPRLALIVVDEEHDGSFKQQESVRYHARDVAVYRAKRRGLPVVLGSATPALETYRLAQLGRYRLLELRTRAGAGSLPTMSLVAADSARAQDGLSDPLLGALAKRIGTGEQSLLFINRRGFAPSLFCRACGWTASCRRCAARLVVHAREALLRCHHCAAEHPIMACCPECGNADLLPLGYGTQRFESALQHRFPGARILRVDRDSTRGRASWTAMLGRIERGEADILVGTQMLAKGHDFPRLTLVGVLGADNALYSADFRATERLFALLLQVSGRAGRGALPGQVIVQTDYPGHPLYQALAAQDYELLARSLLEERRHAGLPPYSYLCLLSAEAPRRASVGAFLEAAHTLARAMAARIDARLNVYAPVPAPMARRAGMERGQMLVRSAGRKPLLALLRELRPQLCVQRESARVRWVLDVDPLQVN